MDPEKGERDRGATSPIFAVGLPSLVRERAAVGWLREREEKKMRSIERGRGGKRLGLVFLGNKIGSIGIFNLDRTIS